ncbi:TetR/AcrR family transcriptional regulator [Caenimonas soli]|uniref:TetR/AcrR family transcriptional regulator n=1 Tax=Caenimonas soli TaxID=2735555 RepID=UPI001553EAD3|nr:TetR/AcrR family transcriptional regulator [Caenimonas soli]NPC57911.1 TetR/AcrR family transcriptional regulator [Caenimonas soli]
MPKKPEFPRREEFLNAALARFSRSGYSATSTREICADLNIVPSAMYNYFPSKEAVILAIEEREMTQMLEVYQSVVLATDGQPAARLAGLVTCTFEQAIVRRASWRLMADMIRSLQPENREHVIERRDAVERMVRNGLEQAIEAKLIPPQDIKLACLQLFSMAEGMSGWYRTDGAYAPSHITSHATLFFLRAIGASEGLLQHAP